MALLSVLIKTFLKNIDFLLQLEAYLTKNKTPFPCSKVTLQGFALACKKSTRNGDESTQFELFEKLLCPLYCLVDRKR